MGVKEGRLVWNAQQVHGDLLILIKRSKVVVEVVLINGGITLLTKEITLLCKQMNINWTI